ncbi:MAG: tRNA nucleotidyltransferase, partial [Tannerella sp.]|nr:tRNA nucleotidyltransferase [Tannerella sp.]
MFYNEEDIDEHIYNEPFKTVSKVADSLGVETYVIGGYVRDIFLRRKSKDIDIVTVGNGIALAEAVAKAFGRKSKLNVFQNYGTAQVKFQNWELEFVGARKESYDRKSRKPVVENGTLEEDQRRRDFTI